MGIIVNTVEHLARWTLADIGQEVGKLMPRKRRHHGDVRFSEWKIPQIDPKDRKAVADRDLVRATLVDFEELATLPEATRERFVEDLVDAVAYWRAGIKPGKLGLSGKKAALQIFISKVGLALERADIPATRWRKTYEGDGGPDPDAPESFFFQLIRALGDSFGMLIPRDLKLAGKRASEIEYEKMSRSMQAAQNAELRARVRQRLGDAPQSCEELASAYLGFPFWFCPQAVAQG
jgi:hypothetical protein